MVFLLKIVNYITVPSRRWHKGACQINSSWSKRVAAAVADSEETCLKFYEALWHTKKFKAGWISPRLRYMLGYACDKTATPAAVPTGSHCLFRRGWEKNHLIYITWLTSHADWAVLGSRRREHLSENWIWKRYRAGTVCIYSQLATWDLENISFTTSTIESDFIFKFLFFPFPTTRKQNSSQSEKQTHLTHRLPKEQSVNFTCHKPPPITGRQGEMRTEGDNDKQATVFTFISNDGR